MFETTKELIFKFGLYNFLIGLLKRIYFIFLVKKYKIEKWHISPLESRIYAIEIVNLINNVAKNENWSCVVEIGCGIGEIIRNLNIEKKIAYDLDENVIKVARLLDKKNSVSFNKGSFKNVDQFFFNCLITVNFIHMIESEELKLLYKELLSNSIVENVLVDSVGNSYKYQHNFDLILPSSYEKKLSLGPFKSDRYILLYKKIAHNYD
jgi:SAM-dependent methyltransferase